MGSTVEKTFALESSRLGKRVYADHAGAALYTEKQIEDVFKDLAANVYVNPHSQLEDNVEAIARARRLTLQMCKASEAEYECILTSGATGAIKLVGEAFPWRKSSHFAYARDNHTSILGLRAVAAAAGAKCAVAELQPGAQDVLGVQDLTAGRTGTVDLKTEQASASDSVHSLFAYPLESNFSGSRYDLAIGTRVQQHGLLTNGRKDSGEESWWVLLDAAKACSSHPPNLELHKPDFVAVSFYKIFGYPTGLGALIVRKPAKAILQKSYFGGGTVSSCSASSNFVRRREGPSGLEDGTSSFLGIRAVQHGFALVQRLGGFAAIEAHAQTIARSFVRQLSDLRHFNEQPVCEIYGWSQPEASSGEPSAEASEAIQGATVAFNFLRADGAHVGHREVETLARLNDIVLRTGCFCNPGSCTALLSISSDELQDEGEMSRICWDGDEPADGRPTGAVRMSFGYASARPDVDRLVAFIRGHFVQSKSQLADPKAAEAPGPGRQAHLAAIWVYPIKSCGGFSPGSWQLGRDGLKYDREWALAGEDGGLLTLKANPQLALIHATVDPDLGMMTVTAPNMQTALHIRTAASQSGLHAAGAEYGGKLAGADSSPRLKFDLCASSAGSSLQVLEDANLQSVSAWFGCAVGKPCQLIRQADYQGNTAAAGRVGFANEAPMLLISQTSLQDLHERVPMDPEALAQGGRVGQVSAVQFRPNFVIDGVMTPFQEDSWQELSIGPAPFEVAGLCARCEAICVDTGRGVRGGKEPLRTLALYRRRKGRINFGILLKRDLRSRSSEASLSVGLPILSMQAGAAVCKA